MKSTKSRLMASLLVMVLCVTAFFGSTYAWFTDEVTSTGNKIEAGTLEVDLLLRNDQGQFVSIKGNKDPIFTYDKWEPGYTDMKFLKIQNEGTLALKWYAKFVSAQDLGPLAEVIDVYVAPGLKYYDPAKGRDITKEANFHKVGTVKDFVNSIESTTYGTLEPKDAYDEKDEAFLGIALKMRESVGNEYNGQKVQGASLGAFDIKIEATQLAFEEDSFDDQYDKDAPELAVGSLAELKAFIKAVKDGEISADTPFVVKKTIEISDDDTKLVEIDGAGITVSRADDYTGTMFTVVSGNTFKLSNITVDGGAEWTGAIDPALGRGTVNSGITAAGNIIATAGNGSVVLNEGTVIQNNAGANAVNLYTRGGGSLIVNGAQIINNTSAAGAIWGGGNITINEGSKINGNHATSIGGAIRMVDGYNNITFTMNGGEMNHNKSDSNGGAIWGGNRATYIFNGGEMAYNSASAGGAIWTGNNETYNIGGTFKLHDNSATELGGAIRFTNYAVMNMTGGEVYNNTVNGVSSAFYLNNNSAAITGGSISDNFNYDGGLGLTVGAADIDGVISYNLSTNHNTAYLAADFNGFKFKVNEADEHFGNFNFKPAAGYTYIEDDEAKLVCMNEGYETYWDAATSTFKLKAI